MKTNNITREKELHREVRLRYLFTWNGFYRIE
jgi:hypothetical protein